MYSLALQAFAAAVLPSALAAPQGLPSSYGASNGRSSYEDNTSSTLQSPSVHDWAEGAVSQYEIHKSCNATETAMLHQAITETEMMAAHARDHILRFGNSSAYYTKYFGKAPTAEPAGWYDRLVRGDKSGVIFRCDDPDQNCATQDGKKNLRPSSHTSILTKFPEWAGHWRGSNASDETVICELSYTSRWYLPSMCGHGYTVAGGELASFFASDLIHRLFHTDKIGEATVFHYADTYDECLALAQETPAQAVRNAHTLQYFALDVWAFDIAVPGQGCTGVYVPEEEDAEAAPASTASSAAAATSTAAETTSAAETAEAATTEAPTSTMDDAESTTESATESAESVS